MANTGKTLVRFNIKNAAYAVKSSEGTYGAPVSIGYSDSISLESDYAEKVIYGDGRKIITLPNDKGKTGTLGLLAIDEAYEIAMKRRMKTASGTAEIKQTSSVEHALYFEFDFMDDKQVQKTGKTIVYGVTTGRPSEAYNQTTDDINNNTVNYPLTIKGTPVLDSTGAKPYVDVDGNTVYAWQETCIPGDAGYETFGKTITAPKVSTAL